jgi:hypothetical protein
MQVSLKDLLAVTAFCAVMAWCAGQAGVRNEMFWIALVVSAATSAVSIFAAKGKKAPWLLLALPIAVGGFCVLPMGSLALIVNLGLLFLAGIAFCVLPPQGTRRTTEIVLTCAMLGFVAGTVSGLGEARDVRALREKYPKVSLASRLEYETRSTPRPMPTLDANVAAALDGREAPGGTYGSRRWRLERIHNEQYERFVRTLGFGVFRMTVIRSESLRRPPLRDIAFNDAAQDNVGDDWLWEAAQRTLRGQSAVDLHQAAQNDFLDPDGFGAVFGSASSVAGFIEHAFHRHPTQSLVQPAAFSIDRLELVSLLKFDEPRVYVHDHLPRRDQLSREGIPTRPLDDFELKALAELRISEDVVTADHGENIRMLGSLRASKQCLECHSIQRGELLGAFSYVLHQENLLARIGPEDSE